MNISMIKTKNISDLKKSEKKNLNITKIKHENGLKCVEFFNNNGVYRGFSRTTDQAIRKALNVMRKRAKKAA